MRRLVLFIEIGFVILILTLLYRRYIRPVRSAFKNAKETMAQNQRQSGARGPINDAPKSGSINSNPQRPIDKSNVQDAEFEDLTSK